MVYATEEVDAHFASHVVAALRYPSLSFVWTVHKHSSSCSSSFHAETIESVRGQSLDLMHLRLRNKELKGVYIYTHTRMHIHIYPDMSAL